MKGSICEIKKKGSFGELDVLILFKYKELNKYVNNF